MSWQEEFIPHRHWYCNMNRDKVICPCYRVTKGDVADAVEKGASTYKEVKQMTKAGKGCGKCKKDVKKLIRKLTEE